MKRIAVLALAAVAAACAAPTRKTVAAAPAKPAPAAAEPAAVAAAKPAAAPAAAARPALPSGKLSKLSGTVAALDAEAGTVTISARGAKRVLRLADGAKLTKGGDNAAIDLGDVVPGARVSVAYASDVLASLHVKVVAAEAPAAKVAKADKVAKTK